MDIYTQITQKVKNGVAGKVASYIVFLNMGIKIMTTRLTGGLNRGYKPTLPASA
ncbi:hypothetical protein [Streptococcus halotolerans]|uniref:hypothetical protein n=1 Tax=Streptococcus halotolerans TaxID=1814128 RepID=UPI0012FE0198|nr:hypothetical protein [Streptococcus halotolerans]